MKSVGECEELEVRSNNKNLFTSEVIDALCTLENWVGNGAYRNNYVAYNLMNFKNGVTYTNTIPPIKVPPNFYPILLLDNTKNGNFLQSGLYKNETSTEITVSSQKSTFSPQSVEGSFKAFVNAWNDECMQKLRKVLEQNIQTEIGNVSTDYIEPKSNIQQLTHEPLRAVRDVKDKYVLIDGKWYIERNCAEVVLDGSADENWILGQGTYPYIEIVLQGIKHRQSSIICDKLPVRKDGTDDMIGAERKNICGIQSTNTPGAIRMRVGDLSQTLEDSKTWLANNNVSAVFELATPVYEPIDYNPFEVYSDTTHISNNSTIPCNMIIKNHGYNTVALKENTQYTLYVDKNTTNALTYRLGDYVEINSLSKFTFTTPSTLTDKTLRIDGKGTKVNDLMLIEGTPTNDSIGYFDGLKSSYECEQVTDENNENYGKYKVDIKVVGKNLFDKSKTLDGYEITNIANGAIGENADWFVTDFIPVIPNTSYRISGKDNGFVGLCYDKNKQLISNLDSGGTSLIRVPNNVRYIKLNGLLTQKDTFQIEEGDTATEYEPYFESKQTVYLNSPLLKGDEIVWKDNKIQHYHKMETIVLDGSADEGLFVETSITNNNTLAFKYVNSQIKNDVVICDKFPYEFSFTDTEHVVSNPGWVCFLIDKNKLSTQDITGVNQWLQQNPITLTYKLKTPYYEEISVYPLKLNAIANSSLSTESTIQVTNISFNVYEETLPYLYPNTKYYITFNADVDRNNIVIDLGGNHVVFDCKVGFNKVEITTPSDTTNLLTFSGTGVNIDHVKVTQQDIDEYFEGMKSVGECEENTLEIICKNNDNSKSNTQTLTHEPLRAVGDIKDKYVLIDGKWYIERNCAEVVFDGSADEYWFRDASSNRFTDGGIVISKYSNVFPNSQNSIISKCDKLPVKIGADLVSITSASYNYVSTGWTQLYIVFSDISTLNEGKQWLANNPITLIYKLASPTYEPIDYNPFEVYSEVTYISNNSLIPSNMVIKNHGYNTILKPSTKYTVALNKLNETIGASLGGSAKVDSTSNIFTITTPSTLNDNILRLSGSGKVKDIMILEGDKIINTPSYFEGIESVFEQEYDTEKGKYRVTARVEGNGKESSILTQSPSKRDGISW